MRYKNSDKTVMDIFEQAASVIPFNPNARNKKNETALQIALNNGNYIFGQFCIYMSPEVIFFYKYFTCISCIRYYTF